MKGPGFERVSHIFAGTNAGSFGHSPEKGGHGGSFQAVARLNRSVCDWRRILLLTLKGMAVADRLALEISILSDL